VGVLAGGAASYRRMRDQLLSHSKSKPMGIDSLWPFLAKRAPEAFSVIPLAQLRNTRVAIDMNFHVFRMFKRCGCDNEATVAELQMLFDFIRAHSIRAVFVFDGNTAGLKARAHAARALASEKAHARVAEYQGTLRAMEDATAAAELAAVELVEADIQRRQEAQAQAQAQALAAKAPKDTAAEDAAAAAAAAADAAEDAAEAAKDTAADAAAEDAAAEDTVVMAEDAAEGTVDTTEDTVEDVYMQTDKAKPDDTDLDVDVDVDVDATYDEVSRPPPAEDVVAAAPTRQQLHAVRELLGKASNNATRPNADLMHRLWRTAAEHGVVVRADDDGEKLVAQLCARGVVDYAVSGDGDTLAFGATQLIRHLDPRYATASVISLPTVIRSLRLLNTAAFVNLAILAGNDMHKLPGIGIVKALQLLNKFGTPEAALACAVEFRVKPPPPDFDVAAIRDRFTSPCLCGADIDVGVATAAGAAASAATVVGVPAANAAMVAGVTASKPSLLSMLLKSGGCACTKM
jgi:5'-3' exonuclease